jgi:hypothetical protein
MSENPQNDIRNQLLHRFNQLHVATKVSSFSIAKPTVRSTSALRTQTTTILLQFGHLGLFGLLPPRLPIPHPRFIVIIVLACCVMPR